MKGIKELVLNNPIFGSSSDLGTGWENSFNRPVLMNKLGYSKEVTDRIFAYLKQMLVDFPDLQKSCRIDDLRPYKKDGGIVVTNETFFFILKRSIVLVVPEFFADLIAKLYSDFIHNETILITSKKFNKKDIDRVIADNHYEFDVNGKKFLKETDDEIELDPKKLAQEHFENINTMAVRQ